jgi:protein-S-isoprenylcysteine O-methyltransferase Ste14
VPGLALVFLLVYLLLAFGVRIAVQLRITGSTGVVGLSGSPGSAEWLGGTLFLAGLVLVPLGCALDLADAIAPIDALDGDARHAIAIALFALGCAGPFYAQLAMGASWRIGVAEGERTELVTRGPFRLVRNPICSAMAPALAGVVLLSPNPVSIAGLALLVIGLEIQVRLVEEPHLMRSHADYPAYAARVGRFVPGVGRLRPKARTGRRTARSRAR